jgi:hypothetical protein
MKRLSLKMAMLLAVFTLFLPLSAKAANVDLVGGKYRVVGNNPIYGKYAGTVTVSRTGSTYYFYWTYVGIASYEGNGYMSGNNQITVQWGLPGQAKLGSIVYNVSSDGVLTGAVRMYSNPAYRGSETLYPGG